MKQRTRSSRLFFIEFLIVLFFFLIVSTVCLRLFVYAHQTTVQADTLSHAQTTASSIAGVLTASDGDLQALAAHFEEAAVLDSTAQLFFDEAFCSCPPSDAACTAVVTVAEENIPVAKADADADTEPIVSGIRTATITIEDMEGGLLYELTVSFHRPITRGEVLS